MTLPIQDLVQERCRALGLTRSSLVRRCGYRNISKGIRRLEQAYAGELTPAITLLRGLSKALDLSPEVVQRAIDETSQQIAAEADAVWRASFKPCAYFLGSSSRPSQIFNFGLTGGAER
jgi:transcriptional regulator with XRE-family HTH domain